MNDDYLWDSTGKPDPEIKQLEDSLQRFRHKPGKARDFSKAASRRGVATIFRARALPLWIGAAAVIAIAIAGWLHWRHPKSPGPSPSGWDVAALEGTPRLGDQSIEKKSPPAKFSVGEVLVTDASSRAALSMDEMGEVQIEPGTKVRLLSGAPSHQRLALDRGTIEAAIWAPPGDFAVDTPSAMAVDLGCAYTLHVDDSGAGLLRTSLGWVGFRSAGRESFIPAGAVCATRPRVGPGTPYYEDASAAFRSALASLDFKAATEKQSDAELSAVLANSRQRDALTLWHLLSRVGETDRVRVYDKLASLVPPPPQVTREGILRLDQQMLDAWWAKLGYGDISLWRTWERSWTEPQSGADSPAK